ncbi:MULTISPECIES: phage portal protein [unclassified Pseudodesulfovibrio]|uniref:phage portal protein n=1 Tax=unclassified Pseudodesulfovibrio TaxID=2661612 RepID=UPI000FEB6A46|nr:MULTISPECIES: phage portal protein [unclassified Pseudodesulfovibrio]MCJ2164645.1 phage portal protein [Pseudodesulfovibrio sp. S3-i]RWU04163.1 phage portal protein [Pseudodesulfovibrio sp. S3]
MSESHIFTFGEPETVLKGAIFDNLGVYLWDNGRYYETPVPLTGLARLLRANAYHGPALGFKTMQVMRGFKASSALSRKAMKAMTKDYLVFENGYFQKVRNFLGEVVELKHLPAINMRRMKEPDTYCMLQIYGELVPFKQGEVLHLKSYDVTQTIYGLPEYLGAIQSMLLNEDATLFRRKYYRNGAHMGYVFYSSGDLDKADQETLKEKIKGTKGLGNFRSMFVHIPNGQKDSIQILPVGDFSTKDELKKIKDLSRDDIIAAHRMPPALACLIPQNQTGFGDIVKIDAVYQKNEIHPIQDELAEEINEVLLQRDQISFDRETENQAV